MTTSAKAPFVLLSLGVVLVVASLVVANRHHLEKLFGEDGAKGTLVDYVEATISGDWGEAYGYLSSEDKATQSLSEFTAQKDNPLANLVASKTTYSVLSIEEQGDAATAQVELDPSGLQ